MNHKMIQIVVAAAMMTFGALANACTITETGEGQVSMVGCKAHERAEYMKTMQPKVVSAPAVRTAPAVRSASLSAAVAKDKEAFRDEFSDEFESWKDSQKAQFASFKKSKSNFSEVEASLQRVGKRGDRNSAFAELDSF